MRGTALGVESIVYPYGSTCAETSSAGKVVSKRGRQDDLKGRGGTSCVEGNVQTPRMLQRRLQLLDLPTQRGVILNAGRSKNARAGLIRMCDKGECDVAAVSARNTNVDIFTGGAAALIRCSCVEAPPELGARTDGLHADDRNKKQTAGLAKFAERTSKQKTKRKPFRKCGSKQQGAGGNERASA
eukprot:2914177-Pleurochrysis_carterae.AAC.1